ncbi:MAG: PTS sugar transporter subunit IIB [Bacilli bacterium]
MAKEVRILVACGSGVATSTVAQEAIKEICANHKIPIKIIKGTMNEIPSKQDNVDLICVTSKYQGVTTKPCITVFGLISGINQEKIEAELIALCNEILT